MIHLFFILATVFSFQALSWDKVGNAGFVIDCQGQVEVFDFFEAKNKNQLLSFSSLPGESVHEKVEGLLIKLEQLDPNRAKNYRFQYKNFWNKNKIIETERSTFTLNHIEVKDKTNQKDYGLGDVSIPENCSLKLALQQFAPSYKGGYRQGRIQVEIYSQLWNTLSNDIKAGLILHELFYRENILLDFNFNSMGVRQLNALLVSDQFSNMKKIDWEASLKKNHLNPMFPLFHPLFNQSTIDLETARGRWKGFKTYNYAGPILKGFVDISFLASKEVISQSPYYILGHYPEYLSLKNKSEVHFTNLGPIDLKVIVPETCLIKFTGVRLNNLDQPKFLSLGYNKKGKVDQNCQARFDQKSSYRNPRITQMSWVKVNIKIDKFSDIEKVLILERDTAISKLTISKNGQNMNARLIKINLDTGEIFHIESRN